MCVEYLAEFILQNIGKSAVDNPFSSCDFVSESCSMLPCLYPQASRFYANQFNFFVPDKFRENPDSVAASAYTGNNCIRQPPFCCQNLFFCFLAYYFLEFSYHCWIGMRPQNRAQQVMGCFDVYSPVPQCFIYCVF